MNPDYLKDDFLDEMYGTVNNVIDQMKEMLKDISTDEPDTALEIEATYDLYKVIKSTYKISSFASLINVFFDSRVASDTESSNKKAARELLVETFKKINPATRLILEMNDRPLVDKIESWM